MLTNLKKSGAKVFYASRNKINKTNGSFHVKCDLSKENDILNLFKVLDKERSLDIFINTAAINYPTSYNKIKYKEWKNVINVNLNAAFLLCQKAISKMKSQNFGKIVNVSSIAGRSKSIASGAHYVSSKAGIIGLTRQIII